MVAASETGRAKALVSLLCVPICVPGRVAATATTGIRLCSARASLAWLGTAYLSNLIRIFLISCGLKTLEHGEPGCLITLIIMAILSVKRPLCPFFLPLSDEEGGETE
jgi:hypothetical protein